MRPSIVIVITVGVIAIAIYTGSVQGSEPARRVVGYGQIRYGGLGPERWAARWRQVHRALVAMRAERGRLEQALRRQRRILLRRPQVVEAINLACVTYGYCDTLWRKARCETGGTFSARSYNSDSEASGLFQFLPSTWDSTPYARLSTWSPYANALAAGWMHDHGRGDEWSCR